MQEKSSYLGLLRGGWLTVKGEVVRGNILGWLKCSCECRDAYIDVYFVKTYRTICLIFFFLGGEYRSPSWFNLFFFFKHFNYNLVILLLLVMSAFCVFDNCLILFEVYKNCVLGAPKARITSSILKLQHISKSYTCKWLTVFHI